MSHAWIQKFCPQGRGASDDFVGVFFFNFTMNLAEGVGGGGVLTATRIPSRSAHLNVIALSRRISRELMRDTIA